MYTFNIFTLNGTVIVLSTFRISLGENNICLNVVGHTRVKLINMYTYEHIYTACCISVSGLTM